MAAYRAINLAVAFLVEIAALVALGYWGFHVGGSTLGRWVLGLGIPAVTAVLWGLFAAPKARYTLSPWARLGVKALVFGAAIVALAAAGHPVLATVFAAVVVLNTVLIRVGRLDTGIGRP